MSRISARNFLSQALATFERFPFTLLMAFAFTVTALYLAGGSQPANPLFTWLLRCFSLGMVLSLSVTLYCESRQVGFLIKSLYWSFCLLLLAALFLAMQHSSLRVTHFRFALISIGTHLMVSFSPFVFSGSSDNIWHFNKNLFLRFFLAVLYAVVLFFGLALALLAMQSLLDFNIGFHAYLYLWILISGVFNTWFFLAGVPRMPLAEAQGPYPRGLKVFTANILLPLVTIYLLILYAYTVRQFLGSSGVSNVFAYMVSAFGFFGILSLLLLYPLIKTEMYRWINLFARLFYFFLIPLALLLCYLLFKRIFSYGFTEPRYIILVLAFWMICISALAIANPSKLMKVIPVSLCMVSFFSVLGPWSMFNVSEISQRKRLRVLFESEKLLVDGKVPDTPGTSISTEGKITAASIIHYLSDAFGNESLQPLFATDLEQISNVYEPGYYTEQKIMDLLEAGHSTELPKGTRPVSTEPDRPATTLEEPVYKQFTASLEGKGILKISGYQYCVPFKVEYGNFQWDFQVSEKNMHFSFSQKNDHFVLQYPGLEPLIFNLASLYPIVLENRSAYRQNEMSLQKSGTRWKANIVLTELTLSSADKISVSDFSGYLLVSFLD